MAALRMSEGLLTCFRSARRETHTVALDNWNLQRRQRLLKHRSLKRKHNYTLNVLTTSFKCLEKGTTCLELQWIHNVLNS